MAGDGAVRRVVNHVAPGTTDLAAAGGMAPAVVLGRAPAGMLVPEHGLGDRGKDLLAQISVRTR